MATFRAYNEWGRGIYMGKGFGQNYEAEVPMSLDVFWDGVAFTKFYGGSEGWRQFWGLGANGEGVRGGQLWWDELGGQRFYHHVIYETSNGWAAQISDINSYSGGILTHGLHFVTVTNGGNDTFHGNNYTDIIWGGPGNDRIYSNGGNDHTTGGTGNDFFDLGFGNDTADGNSGWDTIWLAGSKDLFTYTKQDNGTVKIVGLQQTKITLSVEEVEFGNGTKFTMESLLSPPKPDPKPDPEPEVVIKGNGLANVLTGNTFDNEMFGYGGNDTLYGKLGDDELHGGIGRDVVISGDGFDTFFLDTRLGKGQADVFVDFDRIEDTIGLDTRYFKVIGGAVAKSELRFGKEALDKNDYLIYDQKSGKLYYDPDGYEDRDLIHIATLSNKAKITAADFDII